MRAGCGDGRDARRRWTAGVWPRALAIRSVLSLAVLVLALLALPAAALAAPLKPRITVSTEAGYGRMTLYFADRDKAPGSSVQFNNGVAVLRFDEAVDLAAEMLPAQLPAYVIVSRRDVDGQALRIAVQRQVRINVQSLGEYVFIDFLPPNWRAAPPPIPDYVLKDMAERARLALDRMRADEPTRFGPEVTARLALTVGRRPDLTRLSFTWNVPFKTELTRDRDTVRIGFDRAGRADLADVLANMPPSLTGIDVVTDADNKGSSVLLTVAPGTQVRGFREEGNFVVDLTPASARPSEVPAGAQAAVDLGGATPLTVAAPDAPPPLAAKVSETALPAATSPAAIASKIGELPGVDVSTRPVAARPAGTVEAARVSDESAIIRIGFNAPTAAALFQRQNSIFFVADSTTPLTIDGVAVALGSLARRVETSAIDGGQVLRLDLARPVLATAETEGGDWRLHLGDDSAAARQVIAVRRALRPDGGSEIAADLGVAGRLHRLVDPQVGDTIVAVTAPAPARGVIKPYTFIGGALLPTAHGVAVVVGADDLTVEAMGGRVVIGRPGGLALSSDPAPDPRWLDVPAERPRRRLLTVDATAFEAGPERLIEEERALRSQILERKPGERAMLRLQLARLYIGLRLAPEALGTLRLASDEDPALARDPAFVVLYAAGQALIGRAAAAREALSRPEVATNPDAAFWRTIASAAVRRFDEARGALRLGETVANAYPSDLAALFRLAAAEAELEGGNAGNAQTHLTRVDTMGVGGDLKGSLAVLQGRVLDAAGKTDEAQKRYDEAVASGNRRAEAEAEYRRVTQAVRDGKMPGEEAIKRLQSLAFIWRGDQTELRTLRALANIQAQTGRWRDAFTSMRAADLIGADSDEARLLQVDMAREFAALYLDGKADALDPIQALALYYDFRQLTPPGRLGDEIVRRLADRLVGVDLLDQAAELLAYQVDNRLRGAARAQIAADLAAVHLMNRKPNEALAALSRTDQSGLTQGVERQRRLVRARALADTGAVDQGLMLLANLDGEEAIHLAGEIQWRARRWNDAGWSLTAALGARLKTGGALDAAAEQDVLKAAVAFALGGDAEGLERLVEGYGAVMAKTGSANTFAVVTQPTRSVTDLARAASGVVAADAFGGFLAEYRKRYMAARPANGSAQNGTNGTKGDAAGAKPA